MSEEDLTCKEVATWYLANAEQYDKKLLIVEHPMLYYYMGRSPYSFPQEPQTMTKEHIDKAPAGTLLLWDSHYSFRAGRNKNQYNYDTLLNQTDRFKLIQQYISTDQTFGIFAIEKLRQ